MSNQLERTYRRSLARFPKAWREQHAEVVLGMLLDDAEANGRESVPAAQRVSLGVQALAEHLTFKRVRILAAVATILWAAGLLLSLFPGLFQASFLETTELSPAFMATVESLRSLVSFALPLLLTVVALAGFLYRVGWLRAGFALAAGLVCLLALAASTAGSWLFLAAYAKDFFGTAGDGPPGAELLGQAGFAALLAVPLLLLAGLGLHAFSLRNGRLPVLVVMAVLMVFFAALVLRGSGLIQGLAPVLFLAAWIQERTPRPWPAPAAPPRDGSRPHIIQWTHR